MSKRTRRLIIYLAASLLFTPNALAGKVESRYISANIPAGVDSYGILMKLNVMNLAGPDVSSGPGDADVGLILSETFDAIYIQVSDILDIHMYDFIINIEFTPTRQELKALVKEKMGLDVDMPSYYYFNENTIYLSYEDMTAGMMAHEIAHAIIARYFVVPPPETVQEILSGYVEYSINKPQEK